jgi:hypothetical protein
MRLKMRMLSNIESACATQVAIHSEVASSFWLLGRAHRTVPARTATNSTRLWAKARPPKMDHFHVGLGQLSQLRPFESSGTMEGAMGIESTPDHPFRWNEPSGMNGAWHTPRYTVQHQRLIQVSSGHGRVTCVGAGCNTHSAGSTGVPFGFVAVANP